MPNKTACFFIQILNKIGFGIASLKPGMLKKSVFPVAAITLIRVMWVLSQQLVLHPKTCSKIRAKN
jgi:hypothetical protein